jgi:SAM-dependent methyltransferase
LSKYYNEKEVPEEIVDYSYSIFKCPKCELEFANPLKAGNNKFYDWIAKHKDYYSVCRWEYNIVIKEIKGYKSLLDVGCGNGLFFDFIVKSGIKIDMFGVDTNKQSVNLCLRKGYSNVFSATIEDIDKNLKFDCITSFHCIEHVENPLSFLANIKSHLTNGGIIYLSLPLSPMHFEKSWYDPLNYPPHHMTRWELISLKKLIEKLGLSFEYEISPVPSIFKRINYTVDLIINRSEDLNSKNHIRLFIKEYFNQIKREKINNKNVGDTILMKIKNNS